MAKVGRPISGAAGQPDATPVGEAGALSRAPLPVPPPASPPAPPPAPLPDPRGVQVRLAATSAATDVPLLVIEPVPQPISPWPHQAGLGPLGGIAAPRPVGRPAGGEPVPERPPGAPEPEGDGAAVGAAPAPRDGPGAGPAPGPRDGSPSQPGVLVDGELRHVALRFLDAERAILEPDRVRIFLSPPVGAPGGPLRREVIVEGWRVEVEVEPAARAALRERARRGRDEAGHSGPMEVRAIIPGVVVSVSVAPGDQVVAGQQLLAVEAMKMQNELRSPRDGTIDRVAVAIGRRIEVGDLLLVID